MELTLVGYKRWLVAILLVLSILTTVSLLESVGNTVKGLLFILTFIWIGANIHLYLPDRKPEILSYICICFLLGVSAFLILFVFLQLLLVPASIILPAILLVTIFHVLYIILTKKQVRVLEFDFSFMETLPCAILLILYLTSAFLIAGNIIFAQNGIYLKDPLHGTYEGSISQSVDHLFSPVDFSYSGKELSYNFGATILIHELNTLFGMDMLLIVYRFLPLLFSVMFIFLFYFASRRFGLSSTMALAATALVLLGSLTIFPVDAILNFPQINLWRIVRMASFGLGFTLVSGIYLLHQEKSKIFSWAGGLFLVALAITKTAMALPILLALGISAGLILVKERSARPLITTMITLILSGIYIFRFTTGTHPQVLWVIFPGFLNSAISSLSGPAIYIFPIISLVVSVLCVFGFTLPFVLDGAWKFLRPVFQGTGKFSLDSIDFTLLDAVLFISFVLSMFLIDVSEGNNTQFAIPGLLLGAIFLFRWLGTSHRGYKMPLWGLSVILALSIFSTVLVVGFSSTVNLPSHDSSINPISWANLVFNSWIAPLKEVGKKALSSSNCNYARPLPTWFFFGFDILDGFKYINQATPQNSVILFGRHYEFNPDRDCDTPWTPIGFIHTALADRMAVIENHESKGILMEPDYINRTRDNLLFYAITVDPSTLSANWARFFSAAPDTLVPSYLPYYDLYKKDNYFERELAFTQWVHQGPLNASIVQNRSAFISNFLRTYKVSYIIFEHGERPALWFIDEFNAKEVFFEGNVSIYKIND